MDAQERAKAVVDSVKDQLPTVWLGGRQQAVLQQVIAAALAQVEVETWEKAAKEMARLSYWRTPESAEVVELFRQQAQRAKEGKG